MKKHKPIQKIFVSLAVFTLIFSVGEIYFAQLARAQSVASNASVDELNSQRDQKNRALQEIKDKIKSLQTQITDQRKKIASLNNEIHLFDLQIEQTQNQIDALNQEIDVVNLDVIQTLNQIHDAEGKIDEKMQLLTTLIQEINEQDQISPLEIVLTHNNFSELLNQLQNSLTFQNKNQELLQSLVDLKTQLSQKQDLLDAKKKELGGLKDQEQQTQNTLLSQKSQKEGLLTSTRGQESKYQQLLSDVSEEEAKISREITDINAAIRAKVGDKSLPVVTGALAWPMEGVLTQGYGNTGFTKLGYTFHDGIDIAAPANTPITAAADGVVYATGTGKTAYGNWVVLKHTVQSADGNLNNIMTLYAHLNKISASAGQGILRGDLVGLEGNTGNTTRLLYGPERGYHLHFTVFDEDGFGIKNGAYPEIYGPYQIPYGYTYNPMKFLK